MGHPLVVAVEMARRASVALSGYRLVVNNGGAAGPTIACWPRALGDNHRMVAPPKY